MSPPISPTSIASLVRDAFTANVVLENMDGGAAWRPSLR
jgi:hypothetical protein